MRVIVCGSRSWRDRAAVERELRSLPKEATAIVHGAHWEGADAFADEIACELGLPVERHPAGWQRFGRSDGPRLNEEMAVAGADLCIAFRAPGRPNGTDDMVARAQAHGIPVRTEERGSRHADSRRPIPRRTRSRCPHPGCHHHRLCRRPYLTT